MFKIVGLGEVLWDIFPTGRQLGGAPANFTYHARALGADAHLVSRVGVDALGHDAREKLAALGICLDSMESDTVHATGMVNVTLAPDGQPQFEICQNVAWDFIEGSLAAQDAVESADAVCFGTLAQRHGPSRAAIRHLIRSTRPSALRVFDINLRQSYYSAELIEESLQLANVLKLNDTELPKLVSMFGLGGGERSQIKTLADRFELRGVAFTRGERGSLLYEDGRWSDVAGLCTRVVDTVGAGDAFTAAFVLGLLANSELGAINKLANQVASHVCAHSGATPALPKSCQGLFA